MFFGFFQASFFLEAGFVGVFVVVGVVASSEHGKERVISGNACDPSEGNVSRLDIMVIWMEMNELGRGAKCS